MSRDERDKGLTSQGKKRYGEIEWKSDRVADAEEAQAVYDSERSKLRPRKILRMIDGRLQEPKD